MHLWPRCKWDTRHIRLSLGSWGLNWLGFPHAFCHGFPCMRWLLGCDSWFSCLNTGNTYCWAKLHYSVSFNYYQKKEQRKRKLQFSLKRKARLCSHLFLYFSASFFLLFCSFPPLEFFTFLSNYILVTTLVLFLQELNLLIMKCSIILNLFKIHTFIGALHCCYETF